MYNIKIYPETLLTSQLTILNRQHVNKGTRSAGVQFCAMYIHVQLKKQENLKWFLMTLLYSYFQWLTKKCGVLVKAQTLWQILFFMCFRVICKKVLALALHHSSLKAQLASTNSSSHPRLVLSYPCCMQAYCNLHSYGWVLWVLCLCMPSTS